ncbi:MAG: Fur family transcriptional regulator [Thermoguttaceae bacterium]|nr:Fur family transcriptional regulator [Thermoguttaceae bacterium]
MEQSYVLPTEVSPKVPYDRFADFLRSRGKRLTKQKSLILEMIFTHHDHFDVDELLEHLAEPLANRTLSRPTVYRMLIELVEAGILRKWTHHGRSFFEHRYGYPQHDHLHCVCCNTISEFHSDELDQLVGKIAAACGFHPSEHRLFIDGYCEKCKKQRREDEVS